MKQYGLTVTIPIQDDDRCYGWVRRGHTRHLRRYRRSIRGGMTLTEVMALLGAAAREALDQEIRRGFMTCLPREGTDP